MKIFCLTFLIVFSAFSIEAQTLDECRRLARNTIPKSGNTTLSPGQNSSICQMRQKHGYHKSLCRGRQRISRQLRPIPKRSKP